jgi:hypothetical protein
MNGHCRKRHKAFGTHEIEGIEVGGWGLLNSPILRLAERNRHNHRDAQLSLETQRRRNNCDKDIPKAAARISRDPKHGSF